MFYTYIIFIDSSQQCRAYQITYTTEQYKNTNHLYVLLINMQLNIVLMDISSLCVKISYRYLSNNGVANNCTTPKSSWIIICDYIVPVALYIVPCILIVTEIVIIINIQIKYAFIYNKSNNKNDMYRVCNIKKKNPWFKMIEISNVDLTEYLFRHHTTAFIIQTIFLPWIFHVSNAICFMLSS